MVYLPLFLLELSVSLFSFVSSLCILFISFMSFVNIFFHFVAYLSRILKKKSDILIVKAFNSGEVLFIHSFLLWIVHISPSTFCQNQDHVALGMGRSRYSTASM